MIIIADKIRKDANMSGIMKEIKKDTGVATNMKEMTTANIGNDNRRHFTMKVWQRYKKIAA